MSAVWEQEDFDAPNGVTLVHSEDGLTIHLETEDGEACHTVPQDRIADLHRYLSDLVLPAVERVNLFALGPNAEEFPAYRNSILGDLQVLGHAEFSPGILVDDNTEEGLTPTQARSLAACLLAAADSAEAQP
jgi:hypothetical protein